MKIEICDDFRVEQAHRVGAYRIAKTWVKLLSDRGPSDTFTPLQDFHPEARAREVSRADKPVVTGASDHRIVVLRLTVRCCCHSSELILLRKCETGWLRARYLT